MSFARNWSNKYGKKLLDTEIDTLKTVSKKVFHRSNRWIYREQNCWQNCEIFEEIIIPPEKREEIL